MELGSQICKNINPLCNNCPISYDCKSNQMGIQNLFPKKIKKKKKQLVKVVKKPDENLVLKKEIDIKAKEKI